MGRRKALSAGPKLQSRGANRSGAATIASEAEVSLPDGRGRVLPGASPKTTERSPEPLLQPSTCRPPRVPLHSPVPGADPAHPDPPFPGRAARQSSTVPRRQPAAQAAAPLLLRPARLCIFKPRCSIPLRPITARADPDGEWQPSPRFFKPSLSTNRRPAPLAPPPRSPHPNRFQRV